MFDSSPRFSQRSVFSAITTMTQKASRVLALSSFALLMACGGGGAGVGAQTATDTSGQSSASSAAVGTSTLQAQAQSLRFTVASANLSSQSLSASAVTPLAVSYEGMDVFAPFASWANAKTDYGAKGDGVTDDAPAIQRALNDLGKVGKASVLYVPAGNYKLGSTLKLVGNPGGGSGSYGSDGVGIVGESPAATRLIWAGPAGAPMLIQNGGFNTRYSRLTWDGKSTAGIGVAHWWDTTAGLPMDASPEHMDEVFTDMEIGIMAGRGGAGYGQLNSEGQVRRVAFIRNSKAGLDTGSWNALDWWVWDSTFTDCARGVTNAFTVSSVAEPGAGSMYVYRSVFQRSTVADALIGNTGFFSFHQNVSVGSRRFFEGGAMGANAASVLIQGNRIVDTTEPVAILNGNLGPLTLIDNQIRSASGQSGPAVQVNDFYQGRDVISVGNTFTVSNPIKLVDSTDRLFSTGDSTVPRTSISSALPNAIATPARVARKVYEVPADAGSIAIQALVDEAAASGALNPVIHFPPGTYRLRSTVTIPAKARIQLVGDALTSNLVWTGPRLGTMFVLEGPSYATIRDLQLIALAPSAAAFKLTMADQAGGRVLVLGSSIGQLTATDLTQTQLSFQANTGIYGMTLSNVQSLVSIGAGNIGLVSSSNGTRALMADTWYEGPATSLLRVSSGDFTYLNGHLAPATHPGATDLSQPAIGLDGLSGKATIVGASLNVGAIPSGVGIRVSGETASTKALVLGVSSLAKSYLLRAGSGGKVGFFLNKGVDASGKSATLTDQGNVSATFVTDMLSTARSMKWETAPYHPPANATDVHIYRVHSPQTLGMTITNN
jgi:hypothetical protein